MGHLEKIENFRPLIHVIARMLGPFYHRLRQIYGSTWGLPVTLGDRTIRMLPEFLTRDYERGLSRFALSTVKPGWIVYDVGAYVGAYTVAFAKCVGDQGRVVAFEPCKEARQILLRHLEINDVAGNVQCVSSAVGDACQSVNLYSMGVNSANSLNYHAAAVNRRFSKDGEIHCKPVDCTSIDNFVEETELKPRLIKIDVEGAEVRVIQGALKTLETHRPIVACELHSYQIERFGDSERQLFALLEPLDYNALTLASHANGIKHLALLPRERKVGLVGERWR